MNSGVNTESIDRATTIPALHRRNTESSVTEHPALFSGPMVRAILDDKKMKTRRVVRLPPSYEHGEVGFWERCGDGWAALCDPGPSILVSCPYGGPGDRLWVRETWRGADGWRPENGHLIEYRADGRKEWREAPDEAMSYAFVGEKWRPSIFMPRWVSRLTLEVTDVRIERLQDITEEEARAEGVDVQGEDGGSCRIGFARLWGESNGKRPGAAWALNPWVWVVLFRRVER